MDLGIPPLQIKNLLESNPLKPRFLLRGLTVGIMLAAAARLAGQP